MAVNVAQAKGIAPAPGSPGFTIPPSWRLGDRLFALLCLSAAVSVIVLFIALIVVLFGQAWLAISTLGPSFFVSSNWDVVHREFGAVPFIYGTLATSAIAMLIAVPLGVGTAAFLSEIAPPWLRRTGSFLVELLAAIPSVVYGFWGMIVLAPVLQWFISLLGGPNQGGLGILSAGVILAIMIVPYVSAISFDVCQAVPNSQREGSYALGATRWQTIRSVVLPYARPGIIGGCFLALGRAIGETMAVTMLIGNTSQFTFGRGDDGKWQIPSPFDLGNSIPSVLANEFREADYDLHRSVLVELALVLLLVSIIVNSLARLLIWRMGRPAKNASLLAFLRPGTSGRAESPANTAPERDGTSNAHVGHARTSGPTDGSPLVLAAASRHEGMPDNRNSTRHINRIMTTMLGGCLGVTVGFLLFILGYLVFRGVGALNWEFFTNLPTPVGEPGGGMANALFGSFVLVSLAALGAVPIGVLAAVYLAEYRSKRLGPIVRFIGELLSGVPSIVIGIFAYYLVVKPMGHFSGWAGSFALGVMMIPIVMRATEEALRLVPSSLRDASYALGASQWQTVVKVTLPAALPAIVTAVFLSVARVVGETAPLMFTASNNSHWPRSPNDEMPSLPYFIYQYATSGSQDWVRQGWAAALVLLAVVMLLSFGVRVVMGRRAVSTRQTG